MSGEAITESLPLTNGAPSTYGQTPNGWQGAQSSGSPGNQFEVSVVCVGNNAS
jgi:hypothetical protein